MAKICLYDVTDEDKQAFKDLGKKHEFCIHDEHLTPDTADAGAEVVSVFINSKVDSAVLQKMPDLKLIACRSTGFNNIDLKAAKTHKVEVANVPTYGEHTVAEYAFTLLLALSRKLLETIEQVNKGDVNANTIHGHDLYGKRLGVMGCGRIGKNVMRLGKAFGMEVVGFDPFPDKAAAKEIGFKYIDKDELIKTCDVISLHAPLTKENMHLMGKEEFAKAKRGVFLINTARGELVDTLALVEALQSGQVAGAALDVLEDEKLIDIDEEELILRRGHVTKASLEHAVAIDVLGKMFNVIITTHNAYNTVEAIMRINQTSIENIEAFLAGKPQNLVKL